jgi:hypothetical protein
MLGLLQAAPADCRPRLHDVAAGGSGAREVTLAAANAGQSLRSSRAQTHNERLPFAGATLTEPREPLPQRQAAALRPLCLR